MNERKKPAEHIDGDRFNRTRPTHSSLEVTAVALRPAGAYAAQARSGSTQQGTLGNTMALSEAQLRHMDAFGFLHLRQFFPPAELALIGAEMEAILDGGV